MCEDAASLEKHAQLRVPLLQLGGQLLNYQKGTYIYPQPKPLQAPPGRVV